MTLSEELKWRGFVNQTTYTTNEKLDSQPVTFYWGVDPSADSMQIGNLAAAMMIRHFIEHGHKAILLVGGATGMIGDPDGKAEERQLLSPEDLAKNKAGISEQYKRLFDGKDFEIVDNYDWFKDMGYLDFLRTVGKHVPMSQMLGREFVQSRLGEKGSGISYAEFSYSLIQAYDFLYLHRNKGVDLQLCGADQWGNCIAGVDLIRRTTGDEVNVWSMPLIIDKTTGAKFGKTEAGVVWLDPKKTTPTAFYQFWINIPDDSVEEFLKIYTLLSKEEIEQLINEHQADPKKRQAQKKLASEVTKLVHGEESAKLAASVTSYLTGDRNVSEASGEELAALRSEIPSVKVKLGLGFIEALVSAGLAKSNTEARSLIDSKAVYANGQALDHGELQESDFKNGRLLVRRGKAFKDSALFEL
ncbi:MAG TPA: tyrosine--tRNA ligase [Candidatus Saccharimonadales bacterium]|jgi:tyrosyl-tRNA synthetase